MYVHNSETQRNRTTKSELRFHGNASWRGEKKKFEQKFYIFFEFSIFFYYTRKSEIPFAWMMKTQIGWRKREKRIFLRFVFIIFSVSSFSTLTEKNETEGNVRNQIFMRRKGNLINFSFFPGIKSNQKMEGKGSLNVICAEFSNFSTVTDQSGRIRLANKIILIMIISILIFIEFSRAYVNELVGINMNLVF